jgi:glucose-6-phosphate dehydrogenase assembly protein OpcA
MTNNIANEPGVHLPWAGKMVRIEEIEDVLASLWKMSVDNLRTGANIRVRTSVLNLIICAPDTETAQQASKILRELSSTHLARVIILILDSSENTPTAISAWVTLRCFSIISDLMRHCFEQMTMLASGAAVRSVVNIIEPLLKPDLPIYLWWIGDPPGQTDLIFKKLLDSCTRVMVDSTSFFQPEQDIRTLASLSQASPNCALSDLNWGRLTPWQELIIQFFDVPEYRPYLSGVASIEIEHAVAPLATAMRTDRGDVSPNPTQALLLAGWLKARLGLSLTPDATNNYRDTASGTYLWKTESVANVRTTRSLAPSPGRVTKPGNLASISIRPRVNSEMRPGAICLARLVCNMENKQAIFTISREDDPNYVLTSVELSQEMGPKRAVNLAAVHNESELLRDELEILGHDYLFEQTLQEVVAMLAEEY